jgi:hypothetical protein
MKIYFKLQLAVNHIIINFNFLKSAKKCKKMQNLEEMLLPSARDQHDKKSLRTLRLCEKYFDKLNVSKKTYSLAYTPLNLLKDNLFLYLSSKITGIWKNS